MMLRDGALLGTSHSHAATHPIQNLPSELLSAVFVTWFQSPELSLDALYRIPFTAASICRRWSHIALTTPVIWTCIIIDLDITSSAHEKDRERYIQTMLPRCGSLPLVLTIRQSKTTKYIHILWPVLGTMVGRSHKVSLKSPVAFRQLSILFDRSVPHLTFLELDYPATVAARRAGLDFFTNAPKITHLRWNATPLNLPASITTLPNLQTAHFAALDLLQLQNLLPRLPSLQTLDVRSFNLSAPQGILPIHSDSLQELRITMVSAMGRATESAARSFHFPSLRSAKVSFMSSEAHVPPDVRNLFFRHVFAGVEHLELGSLLGGTFIDGVRACTRITSLTVNMFSRSERGEDAAAFFRAMTQPDEDGRWMFPRLEQVEIKAS